MNTALAPAGYGFFLCHFEGLSWNSGSRRVIFTIYTSMEVLNGKGIGSEKSSQKEGSQDGKRKTRSQGCQEEKVIPTSVKDAGLQKNRVQNRSRSLSALANTAPACCFRKIWPELKLRSSLKYGDRLRNLQTRR
jgi:hypothetical protein